MNCRCGVLLWAAEMIDGGRVRFVGSCGHSTYIPAPETIAPPRPTAAHRKVATTATCEHCGVLFTYVACRGYARRFCGKRCAGLAMGALRRVHGRRSKHRMPEIVLGPRTFSALGGGVDA